MWINHKLVDFSNAAKMNGVSPGCSSDEDEEADEANTSVDIADNMQVDSAGQLPPQPQHIVHEHSGKITFPSMCHVLEQYNTLHIKLEFNPPRASELLDYYLN